MARGRETLFEVAADTRLPETEKSERIGRYLDGYFSMNLRLDHAAFPADKPGVVHKGIPDYLPDGFIDMGSDANLNPLHRRREMIIVDKETMFSRYREDIIKLLSNPQIIKADNETRKKMLFAQLALLTYIKLPYAYGDQGKPADKLGGNHVDLASLSEGVCRHQALTFQALSQFFGLSSRVFKNDVSFEGHDGNMGRTGPHASNFIRINHSWYLIDVTNPDHVMTADGQKEYRAGATPVDRPPNPEEVREYDFRLPHSKKRRIYITRSNSYWRISK